MSNSDLLGLERQERITRLLEERGTLTVAEISESFDVSEATVRRDLAVVLDVEVPLSALRERVVSAASSLLRQFRVFDVYRGPGVESGRKSVALGLIFQDITRTLHRRGTARELERENTRIRHGPHQSGNGGSAVQPVGAQQARGARARRPLL